MQTQLPTPTEITSNNESHGARSNYKLHNKSAKPSTPPPASAMWRRYPNKQASSHSTPAYTKPNFHKPRTEYIIIFFYIKKKAQLRKRKVNYLVKDGEIGFGAVAEGAGSKFGIGGRRRRGGSEGQGPKSTGRDGTDGGGEF